RAERAQRARLRRSREPDVVCDFRCHGLRDAVVIVRRSLAIVAFPLAGVLSLSGCLSSDKQCTEKAAEDHSLPADQKCPSDPHEATEKFGDSSSGDVSIDSLASSTVLPARAICWYRLRRECAYESPRESLLADASACLTRSLPDPTSDSIASCDAHGALVG